MSKSDIDVIAEVLDDANSDPWTYITRNGLKLRLKPVSALLVQEASTKIELPTPPVVYIEDKGRSEENPNDPNYLALLKLVQAKRSAVITTVILTGTEIIEPLPDGLEPPSGEDWTYVVEELAGIPVPSKGVGRYMAWLKYYALSDINDMNELTIRITRLSGGTLEMDVAEAEDSFRDTEERDTIKRIPTTRNRKRGDND